MRFGPVPRIEAGGAILVHSIGLADGRLRKGRVLTSADLAALAAAGVDEVIVARLDPGDLGEDAAAAAVAATLAPDAPGLSVQAPFTGRVNLYAETAGILRVDAAAVARLNGVDEAITLATLPDLARVQARDMVATVKILPYAVPATSVAAARATVAGPVLAIHPPLGGDATLIATRIAGMKDSVVDKGLAAVRTRLAALGVAVVEEVVVPHALAPLTQAVRGARGGMVLILGGSATQDRGDIGPAAVGASGGRLVRFGMPVDPGNLLFLGDLAGRAVVGLPGCVRSPALNGADWVLERLACGVPVGAADIAAMGVGGLLKEIPTRPQPRGAPASLPGRPVVEVLLLAAGSARRMRGTDKLMERVGDEPLLRRAARAAQGAQVARVHVVLDRTDGARAGALAGLGLGIVANPQAGEGMASSIRAGMARLGPATDAVILGFADMPEVGPGHYDRLIAAFSPEDGREIARAVTQAGLPGHPVLFGRRYFENLAALTGDRGAREIVAEAGERLVDVPTEGEGAVIDLDTPEAWAAWRAAQAATV